MRPSTLVVALALGCLPPGTAAEATDYDSAGLDHPTVALGVAAIAPHASILLQEGLAPGEGALVQEVLPGLPAQAMGVQAGDVILEVNGLPITGAASLTDAIRDLEPGEVLDLTIAREGERIAITGIATANPWGQQLPRSGRRERDQDRRLAAGQRSDLARLRVEADRRRQRLATARPPGAPDPPWWTSIARLARAGSPPPWIVTWRIAGPTAAPTSGMGSSPDPVPASAPIPSPARPSEGPASVPSAQLRAAPSPWSLDLRLATDPADPPP